MKKLIAMLLVLALPTALTALAEINPTDAFVGRWKDARATGAEMKILPEYIEAEGEGDLALYPIAFSWQSSEGKQVTWSMTARYNEKTGRLEYEDGVKRENGSAVWNDATGYLALDGAGRLAWTDSRESDSIKLEFKRVISPAPTAEDFADNYFRVVAMLERGASDAAIMAARTIVKVLEFAENGDLWNADGEAMQENIDAAWESLTEDERARFDTAFDDGVSDPADEAFDDYASLKRVFEKAGVGDEMARLVASLEVRRSWEFLSSATLNMGNMDDRIYENAVG